MTTNGVTNVELFFADGLVGCPEWQRFILERDPEMAPLAFLKSVDQPALSLPVINPWMVKPDYAPWLDEPDELALAVNDSKELAWLVVLNIEIEPVTVKANLLGPLAINSRTGLARQVILSRSGYSAAYPVGAALEPSSNEVRHVSVDAAL